VFTELKLGEKQQALFKAMNPEAPVTQEAVQNFLTEYGLARSEEEGEVSTEATPAAPTPQTQTVPFKPTVGQQGTAPEGQTYTSDEIVALIKAGRNAEAEEIVARATRNPNLITYKHADKMPL